MEELKLVKKAQLINIVNKEGILVVSSREVSKNFEKAHDKVTRDINNIISQSPDLAVEKYYIETEYISDRGRAYKEYLLTEDGLSVLVMGFTGQKAMEWKLKYVAAFNKMRETLNAVAEILTIEQKLQLAVMTAKDKAETELAAAALDRYRREQIEAQEKLLLEQKAAIENLEEELKGYTKEYIEAENAAIARVVKNYAAFAGKRIDAVWNELYNAYSIENSIHLKRRANNYNAKQQKKCDELSVVKYAVAAGHGEKLYKLACRMFRNK